MCERGEYRRKDRPPARLFAWYFVMLALMILIAKFSG